MNSFEFNNLVRAVENESFSSGKVDVIATSIAASGQVYSGQVAQLIKLISFDSDQLKVAKLAFKYAIDRGSYASVVGDALTYSSSKGALNKYIREYSH